MPPRADEPLPPDVPRRRQSRAAEARTVPLSGGRVLGARIWPGKEPAVVLLHGLLDSAEGWDALAESIPQRCIAFDLPGFGRSDRVPVARVSAYTKDLLEALDALHVSNCVLVGHSLGGAITTGAAERRPDLVRALVLLAPAGFGRIPLAEAISIPGVRNVAAAALPLALANPAIVALAYSGVITARRTPDPRMLVRVTRSAPWALGGARDGTQAVVIAGLSKRGFGRRRVQYDGPVYVVWGENDHVVPRSHINAVKRGLPQAQVEVWARMGHHPQAERPGALAALVKRACPKPRAAARGKDLAA